MSVKIYSLSTASTINSGDDISIAGNNPFYFNDWGGGWYMQDTTWIRSYASKSLWIDSGKIGADGGLTIGYGGASPSSGGAIIAGSVGIGTTSPNEKLTVNGKIYANPYHPAVISGGGTPYYGANITLASDIGATAGAVRIWSRYDGSGYAAMSFERATNSQSYGQDPQLLTYAESMRISGAGSILIGTTTDAGYKLDVNGTARVSGALTAAAGLFNTGSTSNTWAASSSEGLAIKGSAFSGAIQTITSYLDNTSITIGAGVSNKTGITINGQTSGSGSSFLVRTGGATRLTIDSTGVATFNSGTANQNTTISGSKVGMSRTSDGAEVVYFSKNTDLGTEGTANINGYDGIQFRTQGAETVKLTIAASGAATFASTINSGGVISAPATSGFANATYASNVRNPIWRFGNADAYGLSYFQGTSGNGQDTIGIHFGTATAAGSTAQFNGDGSVNFTGRVSTTAWTTTGRNYSNEWIEFPNYTGLYSSNNGAHFYPNNGSYGGWKVEGTRNDWAGLEFGALSNGSVCLMIGTDSNLSGFHNNSVGWQQYWQGGNLYVSKEIYGGGTMYIVLDAANYGSYALPLSGGILTGLVQSYAAIESDIAFRTAGKFELTSALRGLKSNYYDTEFYPSNTSYWNITSSAAATTGALLFRQGYEGTTKGYVYWDSAGFGLLNNVGNWAVRTNYGGSIGGTLYGSWGVGVVSPVTALDVVGGAYSNTTAKFGASKPVYLINEDPHVGFNTYYNSGWLYGAGSSGSYAGVLGYTSATGDFAFRTSATFGNANNAVSFVTLMTLKQNSNVGINTTAPTNYSGYTTLHINGKSTTGGGLLRLTTSDSSVAANIYTNINGAIYDTTTAHPHYFNINGASQLIVNNDGITTAGSIITADPGTGSAPWKLGDVQSEAVSLVTNQYIEVEINGVYYRLALVEPA